MSRFANGGRTREYKKKIRYPLMKMENKLKNISGISPEIHPRRKTNAKQRSETLRTTKDPKEEESAPQNDPEKAEKGEKANEKKGDLLKKILTPLTDTKRSFRNLYHSLNTHQSTTTLFATIFLFH